MEKKYTAHILSHTHWDREWYLNSPYTNEWLIPFFNGLFKMMDKEPDYKFILDGQLSMIEDYFEQLSKEGYSVSEAKRKLKKYVERQSLFIGPYYLQPDWQLLSEESLVRNLVIGRQLADSLGGSIKSGWMLDNFGQISQTAQLHKLAGIEGLFVWRGVAMDPENVSSEFMWESPDGTQMLSVYLLNSYRNVMRLAEYSQIMNKRMDTEVEKLKPFATTSNLLMMNGYDQEMVPDDIQPYLKKNELDGEDYKTIQNDPDSYIKAIRDENPRLPVLKGALYNGRFISVFPGVMSSRMYLKLQNDQLQKLLEKKAEPMAFMSWSLGDEYEGTQIDQAWKLLLKNHPHDSICGVSIDDVHTDMENRGREVFNLGQSLVEKKAAFLAGVIDSSNCESDEAVIVFNTTAHRRSEVVRWNKQTAYVKDIPALGYKVMTSGDFPESALKVSGREVENSQINLLINENGSFNIKYKATGKEYTNLGVFEDMGDSGDEYNYSYPDNDKRITSENLKSIVSVVSSSDWEITFRVEMILTLPVSDTDKHRERSSETKLLPVVNYITVETDSSIVKCRTTLRNTVRDHRLRVLFPTDIKTDKSYGGSPFDITERPIHIEEYDESQIPPHVKKVIVGAREAKPSTYFHTRELVDLNNGKEGLAVFNKGLPEYQVIDDSTIALTLFRSVGWIAKEINTRIGDAGPEIYTPDAQCLREMEFEYAIAPHEGDVYSGISRKADLYNSDLMVITGTPSPGPLPAEKSWLEIRDSENTVKISSVKKSFTGSDLIVRGVNLSEKKSEVTLFSELDVQSIQMVNLLEDPLSDLKWGKGKTIFSIKGKSIFTLKIRFNRTAYEQTKCDDILIETADLKEDFSNFEYADYVTEDDVKMEERRAEDLRTKINDPMFRRTALEAQLSAILTQHRRDGETIRSLGYKLNEARVQRRIHDYLND